MPLEPSLSSRTPPHPPHWPAHLHQAAHTPGREPVHASLDCTWLPCTDQRPTPNARSGRRGVRARGRPQGRGRRVPGPAAARARGGGQVLRQGQCAARGRLVAARGLGWPPWLVGQTTGKGQAAAGCRELATWQSSSSGPPAACPAGRLLGAGGRGVVRRRQAGPRAARAAPQQVAGFDAARREAGGGGNSGGGRGGCCGCCQRPGRRCCQGGGPRRGGGGQVGC
jgi:hypothetical protein